MNELNWIKIARDCIGQREIKGAKHNPLIVEMWRVASEQLGRNPAFKDDETPWCGGFVGYVMGKAGLGKHVPSLYPSARSWANAGTKLTKPAYGCVVVFSRNGGGHVGFVVGKDKFGNLMVLGGNQSDAVNIKPFSRGRVIAYRWCGTQELPATHRFALPILASDGEVSKNEA